MIYMIQTNAIIIDWSKKKTKNSIIHVDQGRIFQKIWLPSFTKNLVVLQKTGQNRQVFGLKRGQNHVKELRNYEIEDSAYLKTR